MIGPPVASGVPLTDGAVRGAYAYVAASAIRRRAANFFALALDRSRPR